MVAHLDGHWSDLRGSFYVTCALPQGYFTVVSRGWPIGRSKVVRALLGAVGGVAGLILAS
ncbi:MAG: hypothetical protein QM757_21430 [Paludibaculum sp.]